MSTVRKMRPRREPRTVNGIRPCRWCGKPVKGNRWYCDQTCKNEYHVRCGYQSVIRDLLLHRDGDSCSACGLAVQAIQDELKRLHNAANRRISWWWQPPSATFCDFLKSLGLPRTGHTWEADHIVPVVEGGGECGLDNYRILCVWCHRKETAELAKRRAAARTKVPLFSPTPASVSH